MEQITLLRDIPVNKSSLLKSMSPHDFYLYLRDNVEEIQERYAQRCRDILSGTTDKDSVELVVIVDENDQYYRNKDGYWASEFRHDFMRYHLLPESKERPIFCRVALFLLEDEQGNIIVSRRSSGKSNPNKLEIPGGHVTVGHGYTETCAKELGEELNVAKSEQLKDIARRISDSDKLFTYRKSPAKLTPGDFGKGSILGVYLVKVPGSHTLSPDSREIGELLTMAPAELLHKIQSNDSAYQFEPNHAYLYLEYLKGRLPESIESIELEQERLTVLREFRLHRMER